MRAFSQYLPGIAIGVVLSVRATVGELDIFFARWTARWLHGWPLCFMVRDGDIPIYNKKGVYQYNDFSSFLPFDSAPVQEFWPICLVADVFVIGIIVSASIVVCRVFPPPMTFRLRTLLIGVALISFVLWARVKTSIPDLLLFDYGLMAASVFATGWFVVRISRVKR